MTDTQTYRVAREIRAEMARRRVAATTLALAIDVPVATVRRWVNGETPLTVDMVKQIADALEVPVTQFFADAEPAVTP